MTSVRTGMTWLIEANVRTAGHSEGRHDPVAKILRLLAFDTVLRERLSRSLDVIAHQMQLVANRTVLRMYRDLRRGQRKDQPAIAGIDRPPVEKFAEKRPVRVGIFTEKNNMRSVEHSFTSPLKCGPHYHGTLA